MTLNLNHLQIRLTKPQLPNDTLLHYLLYSAWLRQTKIEQSILINSTLTLLKTNTPKCEPVKADTSDTPPLLVSETSACTAQCTKHIESVVESPLAERSNLENSVETAEEETNNDCPRCRKKKDPTKRQFPFCDVGIKSVVRSMASFITNEVFNGAINTS